MAEKFYVQTVMDKKRCHFVSATRSWVGTFSTEMLSDRDHERTVVYNEYESSSVPGLIKRRCCFINGGNWRARNPGTSGIHWLFDRYDVAPIRFPLIWDSWPDQLNYDSQAAYIVAIQHGLGCDPIIRRCPHVVAHF